MSKSVDETVFDFFALLLHEEEPESEGEQEQGVKQLLPDAPTTKSQQGMESRSEGIDKGASNDQVSQPRAQTAADKKKQPETVSATKTPIASPVLSKQALEQLLAPVLQQATKRNEEVAKATQKVAPQMVTPAAQSVTEQIPAQQVSLQTQLGSEPPCITKDLQDQLDDEFQVLFFKIAGLTLAVPLVSLGGIVKIERVNHIIGRPDWFMGVQTHRETQLNIVDTCAWVMPEKYDEELAQTVNYQYLVLLEQSNWGLACESLINAVRIKKSQVNWRSKAGKRPWLAGVVKEQMCGILHVQALIEMLDLGLGCQDPIN